MSKHNVNKPNYICGWSDLIFCKLIFELNSFRESICWGLCCLKLWGLFCWSGSSLTTLRNHSFYLLFWGLLGRKRNLSGVWCCYSAGVMSFCVDSFTNITSEMEKEKFEYYCCSSSSCSYIVPLASLEPLLQH